MCLIYDIDREKSQKIKKKCIFIYKVVEKQGIYSIFKHF